MTRAAALSSDRQARTRRLAAAATIGADLTGALPNALWLVLDVVKSAAV